MEENKVAADEEVEEAIESDRDGRGKSPTLRREPSFSRWCDENGTSRSSAEADGSCEAGAPEDSDDFELPLLAAGGRSGDASSSSTGNRSFDVFRSRSMPPSAAAVHAVTANGDGTKFLSLDVEGGLRISDSAAKLQTLEESGRSPISATVVLKTLFYILLWYTFSTCLTVYNKMLLGNHLGKFPAPLLMNTIHFSMQAILSNAILYVQSRSSRIKMTWRDYFVRVIPTALGTALDVNLSNESLVFISVTFATMCKSAAPIFLLMFAFAFRLETPSFKLVGIILVISVGVLLTVAKETEFEFWGFLFVMLAAVMSGFRWCMTQILLQKEAYGLKNPITLMSYVAPIMAVLTAVLSIFLDPWHEFKGNVYFDSSNHMIRSSLLMLLGGSLAFLMVLTEYILVSATSAVTVTVAGIVKEAVTILVAVFYFHDQFTWIKGSGLLIIMVGVSLFNCYKYQKMKSVQHTVNEGTSSVSANGSAKYVIIDDDIELQDDANRF